MAKTPTEVRSLARSYTDVAIQALSGIAQNGQSESARVAAAEAILNRGWGKPAQPIEGTDDGPPIQSYTKIELVGVQSATEDPK